MVAGGLLNRTFSINKGCAYTPAKGGRQDVFMANNRGPTRAEVVKSGSGAVWPLMGGTFTNQRANNAWSRLGCIGAQIIT